jgi:hypothetical protein
MEAFESFVAVALASEGFVVSDAVKFPVKFQTAKAAYEERQTHGFEVDLVGARSDKLVLATVKSFFGSRGVVADQVMGTCKDASDAKGYALLNDRHIRQTVVREAAKLYGYTTKQVQLRLYVGRFAAPKRRTHEPLIRDWCRKQRAGVGPIEVLGVNDVVGRVLDAAKQKQYRDNPVLVTMKVLEIAGLLKEELPEDIGTDAE